MKKTILSLSLFLSLAASAQNVGINSTGAAPVSSAALDVDMANKGILIPRVGLTTTTAFAPVTGTATTSLMVYNTATAGTFPTNVTPGYYYWNGTAWVRLINSGTAWELLGNAGTVVGTNFLGTIDNIGLDFRTNNISREFIYNTGEAIFNPIAAAFSGDILTSRASGAQYAINAYLTGTGAGTNIFASNASTSTTSTTGYFLSSSGGYNMYVYNSLAANTRPAYVGIHASTTGNGIATFVGGTTFTTYTNGAGGTFSHPTAGLYGIARNATNSTGGIFAGDNATPFTLTTGSGVAANGTITGLVVLAQTAANSVGAYISGNNSTWTGPATGGAGVAATGSVMGTFSTATGTGNNVWGGYFATGNAAGFAYVGGRTGGVDYKINGTGTVATMVDDLSGQKVNMFCPEAPEILFQDYGIGQLVNGTTHITIDPILVNNIFVDATHPLKVFVQLEGDCNGVFVTNKTANGFDVVELQNGNSNVSFSWSIVASRKNTTLPNGTVDSHFQEVRFPVSPLKIQTVNQSRQSATEQSNPELIPVKGEAMNLR